MVKERIPALDLGPDVQICAGETAKIDGLDNFSWLWSDGSKQQVLETNDFGKFWVTVSDNIGCQASDTIVVGQLTYVFDEDIGIKLKYVSVDTVNEKNINLAWSVSEEERLERNSVFVFKKPMEGGNWKLLKKIPANVDTFQDTENNITDETVFEYYVSLADYCNNEHVFSKTHNTIRLSGDGDDVSDALNFNWNYYHDWDQGAEQYELWRKLEAEQQYSFFTSMKGDAKNFSDVIAADAFHHQYVVRAKESGGSGESWSNAIQFDFEHLVFVPNVFTPNDDSYNQYFEITNIGLYKDSRLLIVDRWGKTVFEANGYQNDWNGGDVTSGIYYYMLNLNRNDLQPLKGTLSVIK
jgi:gliding motility-associated-like protein